jgi:hypothetical protein
VLCRRCAVVRHVVNEGELILSPRDDEYCVNRGPRSSCS